MPEPNPIEISFYYTPEVAEAVARQLLNRHGPSAAFAWCVAGFAALGVPAIGRDVVLGQLGLIDCMFTALVAVFAFSVIKSRADYIRMVVTSAKRRSDSRTTMRFGAESISIQTLDSTSVSSWDRLSRVEKSPSFWLFYFGDNQPVPIPTKVLPEGLRERIEDEVRAHGVVVRSA